MLLLLEVTEEMVSTSITTAAAAAEWLEQQRPPRKSGGAAGAHSSGMSSPCPDGVAGVGRCRFFALRCIVWGRYLSPFPMLRSGCFGHFLILCLQVQNQGQNAFSSLFFAPQRKSHLVQPTARPIAPVSSRLAFSETFVSNERHELHFSFVFLSKFMSAWNNDDVAYRRRENFPPQNVLFDRPVLV